MTEEAVIHSLSHPVTLVGTGSAAVSVGEPTIHGATIQVPCPCRAWSHSQHVPLCLGWEAAEVSGAPFRRRM
jgi:hypothetical protein